MLMRFRGYGSRAIPFPDPRDPYQKIKNNASKARFSTLPQATLYSNPISVLDTIEQHLAVPT